MTSTRTKAFISIAGEWPETPFRKRIVYDGVEFRINLNIALSLNKGDFIIVDVNGEQEEVMVEYKWLDLTDNKLVISCHVGISE